MFDDYDFGGYEDSGGGGSYDYGYTPDFGGGADSGGEDYSWMWDGAGADYSLGGSGLSSGSYDPSIFASSNPYDGATNPYGDVSFNNYAPEAETSSGWGGALGQMASGAGGWLKNVWNGDPNAIKQANTAVGLLGMIDSLRGGKGGNASTPAQLRSMLGGSNNTFSDAQRAAAEKLFTSALTKPKAASGADAIRRFGVDPMAPKFAMGGMVSWRGRSPLQSMGALGSGKSMVAPPPGKAPPMGWDTPQSGQAQPSQPFVQAQPPMRQQSMQRQPMQRPGQLMYAEGGALLEADGGGQDDVIDIKAAPGEYIFDADVVSALGDGSNEEGARKLDAMRQAIREHKRSAPHDEIPPKAKSPLTYMKG
jgi:hypothetical protein